MTEGAAGMLEEMARAWYSRDSRGDLYIYGSGRADGQRLRKRRRVPENDEGLAQEVVRQLNARFAMGDLSWFEAPRAPARPTSVKRRGPSFHDVAEEWLEGMRPPEVEESTWRTYRTQVHRLQGMLQGIRVSEIGSGTLERLRKAIPGRPRTVETRLAVLRLVLLDAKRNGLVGETPFDTPMQRRRTKRNRSAAKPRRITFVPYSATELEALLRVLRSPRGAEDRRLFPATEALLLTGLRWSEPTAWLWPDWSATGGWIEVKRSLPKHGTIRIEAWSELERLNDAHPPKNGETWGIVVRPPLADLLRRQQAVSYVGRERGWIFPNSQGGHLNYANWRSRGWDQVVKRAKVAPRPGEAQKSLRRQYVTAALICGRNPKEVAAELGHTTARMVLSVYDAFLQAHNWPSDEERRALARIYGWPEPAPARGASQRATA